MKKFLDNCGFIISLTAVIVIVALMGNPLNTWKEINTTATKVKVQATK